MSDDETQHELGASTDGLIDPRHHEAVIARFHFVGDKPGHEMDRSLHALVLDLLVLVDEVARSVDRSRDTWVGRGPYHQSAMPSDPCNANGAYAEEVRDPAELPQSWELPDALGQHTKS